jgi:hypothetical protein
VVERPGSVDSRFPRHAPPLPATDLLCQLKNLTASLSCIRVHKNLTASLSCIRVHPEDPAAELLRGPGKLLLS